MIAQTPANSRQTGTDRYCITLFTYARRALLAGNGAGGRIVPTPVGNIVTAAWLTLTQELPQLSTEAFYLMPSSICVLVGVNGGMGGATSLRLLHGVIRRFKDGTTRRYNSVSTQDYRSRLWQTAFGCESVDTPAQLTALERQMAAQGAHRSV